MHLVHPSLPDSFVVIYYSKIWCSGSVRFRSDEGSDDFWVKPGGAFHGYVAYFRWMI